MIFRMSRAHGDLLRWKVELLVGFFLTHMPYKRHEPTSTGEEPMTGH